MDGEARVTLYLFQGTYNPIATPWLGLTPTPTPTPDLGPPTGFIDSLQARVLELQFFESAAILLPGAPKVYSQTFSQLSTRYIYWEVGLIHPGPEERLTFVIDAVFYRADGSVFKERALNSRGIWAIGSYRVDLIVDGVLVRQRGLPGN